MSPNGAGLRVLEVWRYPVKSMLGERLESAPIGVRGVEHDRLHAVEDANGKFGSGKTTRRFRLLKGLFEFSARTSDEGALVTLPDGRVLAVGSPALDAALSAHYGEELRVTEEANVSHFDAGAVHLLTTASLRWLRGCLRANVHVARFRPNLLIAAGGSEPLEQDWLGAELRIGSCVLRVTGTTERCVMVNNAQGELPADASVLRALARQNDACLGVYADVVTPGVVCQGDSIALTPSP
jgi:uncharacterized protein YcbX